MEKNKANLMNKQLKILLVLVIISTLIFLTALYGYFNMKSQVLHVVEVPMTLKVNNTGIGFNLDSDALHFGTIQINGSAKRVLSFNSENEGYLYITAPNPVNEFLFLPENFNPEVNKNENKSLELIAKHDKIGSYKGTINLYLLKEEPSVLTRFLLGDEEINTATVVESRPGASITI